MFKSGKVSKCVFTAVRRSLSVALLLLAAAGAMQAQAGITIHIEFKTVETESGPAICPTGVSEPNVYVDKANKTEITWVAYNENYGAEVEQEFAIYFDPFKNSSLESRKGSPKNQVTSPKLGDYDIPLAEYKYTIVGTNCPQRPLDPRITVK